MSGGPQRLRGPSSIRTRFLLVVLLGAVVPLALIGVWLTRSVVRAGEDLLHSELDQSLNNVTDVVQQRWSYRHGDLALLAANEVAQRLLTTGSAQTLAATDSAYLDQLFTSVSATIPSFEYRDATGAVRWASPVRAPDSAAARTQRGSVGAPGPTMTVTLPVVASPGTTPLGTMAAHLSLAALIPTDTSLRLPNGARLQVVQHNDRTALLPTFAPDSLLSRDRFMVGGVGWLAVHRSLADPAIDVYLGAPYSAYVQPFERAAQAGVVTLAIASALVLMITAFLTTRLTASLERLAVAADAVATGDLEHRVDGRGSGEVGRVAAAFNSMTENLRRTLGQLSQRQALAAVGEYAASLAHEIRNGLTAIRVDLQRAEEKAARDTPARPLIGRALENVKRLDATMSGSLRTARSGQTPRRRVDLTPVLRAAAQSAEATFAAHGGTIDQISERGAPAWVLGDAIALEQLFLNLLLNAAQSLRPAGRASVRIDASGPDLEVVIADTGCGISPADLDRVLDPFFSTKPDGTGLGLSIARQIAVAHGGSLRISSAVGEGTRVEVRLPLAAAPDRAGSRPPRAAAGWVVGQFGRTYGAAVAPGDRSGATTSQPARLRARNIALESARLIKLALESHSRSTNITRSNGGMVDATLPWLDGLAGTIASVSIVLFVLVNGLFAANFLLRRDRRFVNRWTKPLVATDAVLLLAAVGTPVAVMAIKLAAKGVSLVVTAATGLVGRK